MRDSGTPLRAGQKQTAAMTLARQARRGLIGEAGFDSPDFSPAGGIDHLRYVRCHGQP